MTIVRQRIVRFYGHVRRHDTLQRLITEGMVDGKRGRGRKRCSWLGNVSCYAGMDINRCAEVATNREEWRTVVSNVVSDKEQRNKERRFISKKIVKIVYTFCFGFGIHPFEGHVTSLQVASEQGDEEVAKRDAPSNQTRNVATREKNVIKKLRKE
ncbi:endonuclease-reverse transcriptase [Elysia marginata]|uniref:Endonuclease-reverse transcriptase n=1 Tax=Elysia marginata TaxID=1093978 RepID=A0AAV4IN74_9GAST|nr:endonuclease-reverse transcriptase [Elysia marginata]